VSFVILEKWKPKHRIAGRADDFREFSKPLPRKSKVCEAISPDAMMAGRTAHERRNVINENKAPATLWALNWLSLVHGSDCAAIVPATPDFYRSRFRDFSSFLSGNSNPLIKQQEHRMTANNLQYKN